jgi:hypothetical protein
MVPTSGVPLLKFRPRQVRVEGTEYQMLSTRQPISTGGGAGGYASKRSGYIMKRVMQISLALICGTAAAQASSDFPSSAILHGANGSQQLRVTCDLLSELELIFDLVQVHVTKSAQIGDFEKELKKIDYTPES